MFKGDVKFGMEALQQASNAVVDADREPYQRIGSWKLEDVPYFDPKWIPAEKRSITRESVRSSAIVSCEG